MTTPFRTPGVRKPRAFPRRAPTQLAPASAGNDPFAGGQRISAAPPPSIGGGLLSPPGGGPTQPTNAVQPGATNFARNNRGSNITIPHARVVPASSLDTALPTVEDAQKQRTNPRDTGPDGQRRPFGGMVESDGLSAGRIGFVLGPRSVKADVAHNTLDLGEFVPFTQNGGQTLWQQQQGHQRIAGSGVDRTDRLCSIEYLMRYMSITTRGYRVSLKDISTGADANRGDWTGGLLGMLKPILAANVATNNNPITDVADFCATYSLSVGTSSSAAMKAGILAHDYHPFIRGKTFATGLVDINFAKSLGIAQGGENRRKLVSRSLPDQLAIALLEKQLQKVGLFDWRPDGVILSKESSGDAMADHEFDMRLQQLFNVAVQGPATLTNLVGDKSLVTMPGDLVFVAIVCDRMTTGGAGNFDGTLVDTIWKEALSRGATKEQTALFERWRKDEFGTSTRGKAVREQLDDYYTSAKSQGELGNFRIRMETSSHMIHASGANPPREDVAWKLNRGERMGLGWGEHLAEYVLGAWCIGRVMDSASSRSQVPGAFSNTNPTSYAVSIDTHVEWWSGDRLFRSFCDKGEEQAFLSRSQLPMQKPVATAKDGRAAFKAKRL